MGKGSSDRLARNVRPASKRTPPIVGRNTEIEHISGTLDQVATGAGHISMFAGEPGIGKTRLVEEAIRLAGARGCCVLTGACLDESGVPPLWPWISILRSFVERNDLESLKDLIGRYYVYVENLLPGSGAATREDDESLVTHDGAQFALFSGFAQLFKNASEDLPLMLVIEDLQWADNGSLKVLEFVCRSIAHMRVYVVCTYRDNETYDNHLEDCIGALMRESEFDRTFVDGLNGSETAQCLKCWAGCDVDAHTVELIHGLTDGNPLFVRQFGAALAGRDWESESPLGQQGKKGGTLRLPQQLAQLVSRRVNRLSDTASTIIKVASLLSEPLDPRRIFVVADAPGEVVVAALDEGCANHLLEVVDGETVSFRFCHLVIKELVAGLIPPGERANLHLRIAVVLDESVVGGRSDHASELFHHASQAGALLEPEKTAEYAYQAGAQAMRFYDCERALSHFEDGLTFTVDSTDYSLRGRLLQGAGQAATHIVDNGLGRAIGYFEQAAESYIRADDIDGIDRLLRTDEMLQTVGCSRLSQERQFALILDYLPAGSPLSHWAHALYGASVATREIESKRGQSLLDEAFATANATGDRALEMLAMAHLAFVHFHDNRHDECFACAARARELSEEFDYPFIESGARLLEVGALKVQKKWTEYADRLAEFRRVAQRTGYPRSICFVRLMETQDCLRAGEWERALKTNTEMTDIAWRLNELHGTGLMHRGRIALWTGDTDAIDSVLSSITADLNSRTFTPGHLETLARHGLLYCDPAIIKYLEQGAQYVRNEFPWSRPLALARLATAVAAFLGGDIDRLNEQLAEISAHEFREYPGDLLAPLYISVGEAGRAREILTRTYEASRNDRPLCAWLDCLLGEAYSAESPAKDLGKAEQHFELSEKQATGLRMILVAERARRGLESLGRVGGKGRRERVAPAGLTPREIEVLRILTLGRQDKEIAKTLNLSTRTVQNHVRNILRKTGSGNRTEAARFATENGVLPMAQ
jgi:DNA-binding CsgD family transcriptional regulator